MRKFLRLFKQRASIEAIRPFVEMELRTLQRRLMELVKQGRISTSGQGKGTLYHLVQKTLLTDSTTEIEIVPLSDEGKEVQSIVSQPVAKRRPVGYNIGFLMDYRSNIDSYLSSGDKAKIFA